MSRATDYLEHLGSDRRAVEPSVVDAIIGLGIVLDERLGELRDAINAQTLVLAEHVRCTSASDSADSDDLADEPDVDDEPPPARQRCRDCGVRLMATKQLEFLSAAVEQVNAKQTGIRVAGEWLNISQYHPVPVIPQPGQLVEVQVERTNRGAWINTLRIIDSAPATSSPTSTTRDRQIRRLACLKAAATFCGGKALNTEVSTADVLKVAAAFERWVLEAEQGG